VGEIRTDSSHFLIEAHVRSYKTPGVSHGRASQRITVGSIAKCDY
jgi:hypothetical protein